MHCVSRVSFLACPNIHVPNEMAMVAGSKTCLVEGRHRLICTSNLNLEEGGLVAVAVGIRTLDTLFLCIVPGARASKDVFLFLARKGLPGVHGLGDGVLVRARPALDSVASRVHPREDQEVGAVRADWGRVRWTGLFLTALFVSWQRAVLQMMGILSWC